MSVIVTLTMAGESDALEQYAGANQDAMQQIVEQAKSHGLIAHRFYGSSDGQLMVIDEWPDEQSFQSFFEQSMDRIGPLMQAAGVEGPPQPAFWRKLETHDEVG